MRVQGTNMTQFHYLRSDYYNNAGRTEAEKRRHIESSGAYGPWHNSERVRVLIGERYVFIPKCGGSLRLASLVPKTFLRPSDATVSLSCPQ